MLGGCQENSRKKICHGKLTVTRWSVSRSPGTARTLLSIRLAMRPRLRKSYKLVADPNLIGKMSDHVEGSKAFARYRDIDDETLKDVISCNSQDLF